MFKFFIERCWKKLKYVSPEDRFQDKLSVVGLIVLQDEQETL